MSGGLLGFIIWALIGCLLMCFGIVAFMSGKPTGFWANAKMFEVTDVKRYNAAMGKLWLTAGGTFILLGLPLLFRQNSPWMIVTLIGVLPWAIGLMIVYELGISRKYRKR